MRTFKSLALLAVLTGTAVATRAAILFDQMTNPTNIVIPSSWVPPDGRDGDTYSWDNFWIPKPSSIKEVWWIGGGGPISGVTVRFYEGLAGAPDYQPKITALPESEKETDYLKGYRFTLEQTNPSALGGGLYQYHVTLTTPLVLPNKVFWVKIEGDGVGTNTWGLVKATHGRDASHFRFITGHIFQRVPGSLALQLRGDYVPVSVTPKR